MLTPADGVPLQEVRVEPQRDDESQLVQDASEFMRRFASRSGRDEDRQGEGPKQQPGSASSGQLHQTDVAAQHSQIIRVTLEWWDLQYSVAVGRRRRRGTKTILQGMSAVMPHGRLLAIMGPTGCGKSSLVNALAGRLPVGGRLEGEILINGLPRGKGFRSITAYVTQDDVLFHNLTVFETLQFAARMRLPSSMAPQAKAAQVERVIAELGLAKARDTYVGNAFVRGISGGERKRVNIGVELLASPSLLFLDEPTSGLDAFQAQSVMESLWGLAKGGRSVVATIHQPRSSIFKLFDLLLVLSEGRTSYYGPAEEAVGWYASCGFPCPPEYNPADFFADVVATDHRSPEAEAASKRRIALLVERFAKRQAEGQAAAQAARVDQADQQAMQHVNESPSFPNSLPVEFGLLLARAWKQQSRDRLPQMITLMQTLVLGFVLAALFSDIQKNVQGVQDELGVIFMSCMFNAMAALFASLNTFPQEAGIVNRERAGKEYHVSPYYLARCICDMPLRVGQGLLFGVIVYWIVGLNPSAGAFFVFVALTIMEALASQALGVAVSAACPTEKLAFAAAPGITVVLMLFGGFFVSIDSIPAAIRWICYISHLYYAFMGLTINNFRGRTGWSCADPSIPDCQITGDQILARLGFEDKGMWEPFTGLACLIVGYNLVGYLVLRFSKQRFLPLTAAAAGKKRA